MILELLSPWGDWSKITLASIEAPRRRSHGALRSLITVEVTGPLKINWGVILDLLSPWGDWSKITPTDGRGVADRGL